MTDQQNTLPSNSPRRPTVWQSVKNYLHARAKLITAVAYPAVLFAALFPHDFRQSHSVYVALAWAAFMLRTFYFHGGLILLLIAIPAIFYRRTRLALATLPLLFFLLGPTAAAYLPTGDQTTAGGTGLKVVSVNMLYINRDLALIDEIAEHDPDVIVLQEYTEYWHEQMQQRFGASHPHAVHYKREDAFGAAIYSRVPFVEGSTQYILLAKTGEPQIRVAIEIDGRPFALYNVHLFPPSGLRATQLGREQFADLVKWLEEQEDLPLVLAGDFNFTPRSPQAAVIRRAGLLESHHQAGWGRGATWTNRSFLRYLPGVRLDHIYYSPSLRVRKSEHGTGAGSDHRPVIVTGLSWDTSK